MSHIPLRKEKDCLNCGTIVEDRFCSHCGQENVVPKETFWHMTSHFVFDIFHFDGKFFETVKDLLFKPGFLTSEYMKGRRASYLHPIKMYVFTSAVFFLLFFGVFSKGTNVNFDEPQSWNGVKRLINLNELEKSLLSDSAKGVKVENLSERLAGINKFRDTSQYMRNEDFYNLQGEVLVMNFGKSNRRYKTTSEYDSVQAVLPKAERDNWFNKRLTRKSISINNKYRNNPDQAFKKLGDSLLHRLPYLLFVSLPLFALILKIVYIRRKQFLYADHGVFTLHLYVFSFIMLFLVFCFSEFKQWTQLGIFDWLTGIFIFLNAIYLLKAMKRFYGQRWFKTIIKFLIVAFSSLFMMILLLAIFFFFTAYEL